LEKAQNNLKEKLATLDKFIKEGKKKYIVGNEIGRIRHLTEITSSKNLKNFIVKRIFYVIS